MPADDAGSQLHCLAGPVYGFGIAAGEIMRCRNAGEKEAIQRIAWAHPDRLLQIRECVVRLAVKGQCPPDISIGRSKVRIEINRCSKATDRLISLSCHEREITERHVRPRITLIQFDRALCKIGRNFAIAADWHPSDMG